MQEIDEIVPTLLHALDDNQISDTALDGWFETDFKCQDQCCAASYPSPSLCPHSSFCLNAHALEALAEVAGPALLTAMGYTDMEIESLAKKAAETVVRKVSSLYCRSFSKELEIFRLQSDKVLLVLTMRLLNGLQPTK
ncbi:PREDICTED: uncharacterized protein LOC109170163 [Ipomoea nil]|uniref:uncharacterized protein LOC109170163 n=1 Tax=Ipomoea nil TaxID=35883 RepID=UPI0009013FFB|nr:PREDICTED: uncharacterized protein LOC109170163 [Ipomoea nil]